MIRGQTTEESVKLTAKLTGLPESDAEMLVAIAEGEIDGDVIDHDGHISQSIFETKEVDETQLRLLEFDAALKEFKAAMNEQSPGS